MKIKIKVTKEILERSACCTKDLCTFNCAIAEAIREIFPWSSTGGTNINIWDSRKNRDNWLSFRSSPHPIVISLPFNARLFIQDFDLRTPDLRIAMTPISFDIEVPNGLINQIGIGQVYKILSESKSLEMVMN